MPDSSERRHFGRCLIVLPILHKPGDPAAGDVGVGWTRNAGDGGTYVDPAESLRPQTPLSARNPHSVCRIEGEVRRLTPRHTCPRL